MAALKSEAPPDLNHLFRPTAGEVRSCSIPLPGRTGRVTYTSDAGTTLIDSVIFSDRETPPWSHYNDQAFVELNFMLEGRMYQSQDGVLHHQLLSPGYHNMLFNPASREESRLIGNGRYRCFGVHIEPGRMKSLIAGYIPEWSRLADKIDSGKPFVVHAPQNGLSPGMRYLFDTVWSQVQSPGLRRLHFEAFAMKLLSLQCEAFFQPGDAETKPAIPAADKERLYHARGILLTNLSDPPTVRELALGCGLNEFKLKNGFRRIFDCTVLGFVHEQRLERARAAIYAGGKTISEIAYELGYAHPQHFHRAFRKRYGITPKSLTK